MIDTDAYSSRLRAKALHLDKRELLVANFTGSGQEADLTDPPNCGGVGRVRHFHRSTSPGWSSNPLPIDPASAFLGLPQIDELQAQVFQNAACNWRCWYCFVPFPLLAGSERYGAWVTPDELVERYLAISDRPSMIDLTGGQPDLVPEWVPWMMGALRRAGVHESVYLWSDDNLSNDYFWRYLDGDARRLIAEYPGYGRVCCFKGFDVESFAFNTSAAPDLFDRQFELFSRLLNVGFDIYAYATFTAPTTTDIELRMQNFVDRLQRIDEALPLRVVPLEISEYGPVTSRLDHDRRASMRIQNDAIVVWQAELDERFSSSERAKRIDDVRLGRR